MEKKLDQIKGHIAKVRSEVEHGDTSVALLAVADALNSMLHFCEDIRCKWEEARIIGPTVVGPDEGDHPKAELPQQTRLKVKK